VLVASCGRLNFDGVAGGDGPGANQDATGGDGATGDGELGGTAAVVDCAASSLLLCDTFEKPNVDSALWITEEFNGAVTIDSPTAHRGARSLHSTIVSLPASGASNARAVHVADLPTHVFIRAFIRQHGTPAAGAMYLNPNAGTTGPNNAIELRNVGGTLAVDTYNPANTRTVATASFPADTWTCVELELQGLPTTGTALVSVRVYVEDVVVPELQQTVQLGPMIQLAVGVFDRSITDAWLDDLIVDTQRIGCAK
jgi:hypothetical protein